MFKKYAILAIMVSMMTLMSACDSESTEETNVNNVEEKSTKETNNLNEKIGETKEKVYECDEEVLKKQDIEYNYIMNIEEKLEEEAFLNELKEGLNNLREDVNSFLYEERGCFLSLENVCYFNIVENALMDGVNCYFFTEDKEPAGEVMFFLNNGKIDHNISWYTRDSMSYILKKLSENPDEKYVILTNGYNHTLIDKFNSSSNIDFKIKGDVYHVLDYERIGVSYDSLIQNMIWIEF